MSDFSQNRAQNFHNANLGPPPPVQDGQGQISQQRPPDTFLHSFPSTGYPTFPNDNTSNFSALGNAFAQPQVWSGIQTAQPTPSMSGSLPGLSHFPFAPSHQSPTGHSSYQTSANTGSNHFSILSSPIGRNPNRDSVSASTIAPFQFPPQSFQQNHQGASGQVGLMQGHNSWNSNGQSRMHEQTLPPARWATGNAHGQFHRATNHGLFSSAPLEAVNPFHSSSGYYAKQKTPQNPEQIQSSNQRSPDPFSGPAGGRYSTAWAGYDPATPSDGLMPSRVHRKTPRTKSPTIRAKDTPQEVTEDFLSRERTKAKAFIHIMQRNGFGFQDIAQDNPALDLNFLRGIYQEMGIDTGEAESKLADESSIQTDQRAKTSHYQALPTPTIAAPIPHASKPVEPSRRSSPLRTSASHQNSHSSRSDDRGLEIPTEAIESNKQAVRSNATTTVALPNSTRAPTTSMADAAQVDRSDYIARLMAAKTKKVAPSVEAKDKALGSLAPRSAQPPVSVDAANSSALAPNDTAQSASEEPVNADMAATEKRKAQTELAKRKIEELKAARLSSNGKAGGALGSMAQEAAAAPHQSDSDHMATTRPSHPSNGSQTFSIVPPVLGNPSSVSSLPFGMSTDDRVTQFSQNTRPAASRESTLTAGQIPGLSMTSMSQTAPPLKITSSKDGPVASSLNTAKSSRDDPSVGIVSSELGRVANQSSDLTRKPFGQSDDDEMIIEASDDEMSYSEGEEGEVIEDDGPYHPSGMSGVLLQARDAHDSSSSNEHVRGDHRVPAHRTPPRSKAGAADDRSIIASEGKDLEFQEAQIMKMKRKIAEMEERKKTKASNTGSPDPTATVDAANTGLVHNSLQHEPDHIRGAVRSEEREYLDSSAAEQRDDDGDDDDAVVGSTTSARASPSDASNLQDTKTWAKPVLATSQDSRRRRRAEIESGLPLLEANFAENSSKLALLRAQMKQLEESIHRDEVEKGRLVSELKSLGVDTSGIPSDELQDTRDQIVARMDAAKETDVSALDAPSKLVPADESSSERTGSSMSMSMQVDDSPEETNYAERDRELKDRTSADGNHDISDDMILDDDEPNSQLPPEEGSTGEEEYPVQNLAEVVESPSYTEYVADDSSLPSVDEKIVDSSGSESGEIRSEESTKGNEFPDPQVRWPSEPAIQTAAASSYSGQDASISISSDEYEPPDVQGPELPQDSPRPDPIPGHEILKIDQRATEGQSSSTVQQANPASFSPSKTTGSHSVRSADSSADRAANNAITFAREKDLPREEGRFTPYDSPLKIFKAYRNHPDFDQNVAGGYRSATYSHKIDADQPLCPFEATGGACNDSQCNYQHFRSLTVTDDMILLQLGMNNPGEDEEEQSAWAESLKALLKDLRDRKVNDTRIVASEISTLRRSFHNDPSRILDL